MRILIVEDEFLPALLLEGDLRAAGWNTIGPYHTLATATAAIRREKFDVAVLDINLNGEMVYPLADELMALGIPFIFLSGYGLRDLPDRFRSKPKLPKPYDTAALMRELTQVLTQSGH